MEAKLRIEVKGEPFNNQNFYGNSYSTKVVEDVFHCEYDNRENIAPLGIKATLKLENGDTMTITADKNAINYDTYIYGDKTNYYAFFHVDNWVYELEVTFLNDNLVDNVSLSEWYSNGDFEDGVIPDKIYSIKSGEITLLETIQ